MGRAYGEVAVGGGPEQDEGVVEGCGRGDESRTVPIGRLSTGQRQRLALARLFSEPVDLLLLDEPTNHLSLGLVEELEAALEEYQGAVVVVSHDRRLCRRWSGETREVA